MAMTLTLEEQSDLSRLISTSTYKVLVKLWEDELRELEVLALYNVPDDASNDIRANRSRMAQAAAAYHTRVRNRIEREAQMTQLNVVNEPFEDITSELMASMENTNEQ